MAAAEAASCYLGRLPLDCLLKVLQARASLDEQAYALSARDLVALLVAAPKNEGFFGPAVSEAAGARIVALLGAAASFNAPQRAAQAVLRLALAERVDCDVRSAGFSAAAAAASMRTTIMSKVTGRVASYGDAASSPRQGAPRRERIRACANTNNLSLVVCDPAVVYIFGWFHGNFVWHERSYSAEAAQSPSALKLTAAVAEPAVAPPPAAVPAVAVAPVVAAASQPQPAAGAEDEVSLEERVSLHLRRVRHYIARRHAALLQL